MKGEETRIDSPCKFVCQGAPSHDKGKLLFLGGIATVPSSSVFVTCNLFDVVHVPMLQYLANFHPCYIWWSPSPHVIPISQVSLSIWTK